MPSDPRSFFAVYCLGEGRCPAFEKVEVFARKEIAALRLAEWQAENPDSKYVVREVLRPEVMRLVETPALRPCVRCKKTVPPDRGWPAYHTPMCHECLPPPSALPVIQEAQGVETVEGERFPSRSFARRVRASEGRPPPVFVSPKK